VSSQQQNHSIAATFSARPENVSTRSSGRSPLRRPGGPSVVIEVDYHQARVLGGAYLPLRSILACTCNRFELGGPQGHQQQLERAAFYQCDGSDLLVRAGLTPRIVQHLRTQGLTTEVRDRSVWQAVKQADSTLVHRDDLLGADRCFLRALAAGSPRGRILARSAQTARLMALLAAHYPSRGLAEQLSSDEACDSETLTNTGRKGAHGWFRIRQHATARPPQMNASVAYDQARVGRECMSRIT